MTRQSTPDTGTDGSPDTGTMTPDTGTDGSPDTGTDATDWKAEAAKWQALSRKHEDQAKANAAASRELAKLRRETMTEQEQAVAAAAEEATAKATAEVIGRLGGRLVVAEIRGAVAGRLPAAQLDALIEHLDLRGFLDEAGEVDGAAVAAFAQSIAPEKTMPDAFPELGQGPRAPAINGGAPDPLLNALKGKLGISH